MEWRRFVTYLSNDPRILHRRSVDNTRRSSTDWCQRQVILVESRDFAPVGGPVRIFAITFGKKWCGYPKVKNVEDTFIHFDRIHERDRQTPHDGIGGACTHHRAAKRDSSECLVLVSYKVLTMPIKIKRLPDLTWQSTYCLQVTTSSSFNSSAAICCHTYSPTTASFLKIFFYNNSSNHKLLMVSSELPSRITGLFTDFCVYRFLSSSFFR